MNDIPIDFHLHYHPRLIDQCWWMFELSGHFPDIRDVARMDQNYLNDMMTYGQIIAYAKTQAKRKHG